jgi:hypothetical protein
MYSFLLRHVFYCRLCVLLSTFITKCVYWMFHLNAAVTTAVFVSFGDVSMTKQTSCFFIVSSTLLSFSAVNTVQRQTCFLTLTLACRSSVASRFMTDLFGTPLSAYSSLNASGTAVNCFDAKWCWRTNTRSACEHTMFARAQLLRIWREQGPSNK